MNSEGKYSLEVQAPFSTLILTGKKTIETRAYQLPPELHGKNILLLESTCGLDGISAIGDNIIDSQEGLSIIGEIFISESKEYSSQSEWNSDREAHKVPKESSYEYAPTESGRRYGWIVERVIVYDEKRPVPAMKRRCVCVQNIRSQLHHLMKDASFPSLFNHHYFCFLLC